MLLPESSLVFSTQQVVLFLCFKFRFIIYDFLPPFSDQTPMIRSASDWLKSQMSTLPLLLVMKTPINTHTSLAWTRKTSFTHVQTATNHSWHPVDCAVLCVCAGSQPCMISFIVPVCMPSQWINVPCVKQCSNAMHAALSDPPSRTSSFYGHLKIGSVWFSGINLAIFFSCFLEKNKIKSNNFLVSHVRLYRIIFIPQLFTELIHPVWILLPFPAPSPTAITGV